MDEPNEKYEIYEDEPFLKRLTGFLSKNICDIAIVLLCVIRIVFGLADIERTGKSIIEIFGDGFVTLVFSLALSRLMDGKGLLVGTSTTEYNLALEEYRTIAKESTQYITKLGAWCKTYSEEKYKETVSLRLLPLGLTFEQFVENKYDETKFTNAQKLQLLHVRKLRVERLTVSNLLSGDCAPRGDIDYTNVSKEAYMKSSTKQDLLLKTIVSFVFGYFTVSPILSWNWSGLIWALLQTIFVLGLSVIKYYTAYTYATERLKGKLVYNKNVLTLFIQEQKEKEGEKEDEQNKEDEHGESDAIGCDVERRRNADEQEILRHSADDSYPSIVNTENTAKNGIGRSD